MTGPGRSSSISKSIEPLNEKFGTLSALDITKNRASRFPMDSAGPVVRALVFLPLRYAIMSTASNS